MSIPSVLDPERPQAHRGSRRGVGRRGAPPTLPVRPRFLALALIAAALSSVAAVRAQVPPSERLALIAFYEATNGDGWHRNDGWLGPPGTECTWEGVSCEPAGVHVTGLGVVSNNLTGRLPSELAELDELRVLVLFDNRITGAIPPELGSFPHLQVFDLARNRLSGPVPPELGGLENASALRLGENELSGSIPPELGKLTALQELSLGKNSLAGSIPPELGDLTRLLALRLQENALSGAVPSTLGWLADLVLLDLSGNRLTGSIPPELGRLERLIILDLSRNQLGGAIPEELGDLSNLRDLRAQGNELIGHLPAALGRLAQLDRLDLQGNSLGGPLPPEIAGLEQLQRLHLTSNQLSGPLPPEIGDLSSLRQLWLSSNRFTEIPPEIGRLDRLEDLLLGSNDLTGPIQPALGTLERLERLNLSDNRLSGILPSELTRMQNLRSLFVAQNELSGLPPAIGDFPALEVLTLSRNSLALPLPDGIGQIATLRTLTLDRNELVGVIPGNLLGLVNLEHLDLSFNGLFTEDPALLAFLEEVHNGLWKPSQTLPPEDLAATGSGVGSIELSWTPLGGLLPFFGGGYRVYLASVPGGPYTLAGETPNKFHRSFEVEGLEPGRSYSFVVRSVTVPELIDPSLPDFFLDIGPIHTLVSVPSPEVKATTLTPEEALAALGDRVRDLDVPRGLRSALGASLDAAVESLARGATVAARHQIAAFLHKVRAQRGKALDPAVADRLTEEARAILAALAPAG